MNMLSAAYEVTHCKFGNSLPSAIVVAGTVQTMSPRSVACVAPPHAPRPATLFIQVNATSLDPEIQEITMLASPASPPGGFFVLQYLNYSTRPIAFDAPAMGVIGDSVQELLAEIPVFTVESVTRVGPDSVMCFSWYITFSPSSGDVGALQADGLLLVGDSTTVSVKTIQDGPATPVKPEIQRIKLIQSALKAPMVSVVIPLPPVVYEVQQITISSTAAIAGTFTVSYGGQATTPLDWDIEATSMMDALNGLPGVGTVDIERLALSNLFGWS